jgi:hypothetical protein
MLVSALVKMGVGWAGHGIADAERCHDEGRSREVNHIEDAA